jgi:hypothetical protein
MKKKQSDNFSFEEPVLAVINAADESSSVDEKSLIIALSSLRTDQRQEFNLMLSPIKVILPRSSLLSRGIKNQFTGKLSKWTLKHLKPFKKVLKRSSNPFLFHKNFELLLSGLQLPKPQEGHRTRRQHSRGR